ncbi:MAG: ATP-binding cassette domain-containing protein, partial [Clostridium sp.]|nr:ATP-binding cassette domain-containing protein [Clostridium sp.]
MIEVKNITKKYGNTKVVDNVSLNIEKGKMISLIGPNGAGKSTVLSMITRLLKMDEGEVIIDGIELSKWNNAELSKKISILKQSNNINLRLTIRDLVEFGRFPYSQGNLTKEDIKYIDEALKYMNI